MTDKELIAHLVALTNQGYPLAITENAADAIVECISRVMAAVPDDDRPFVRSDYDLVTSAIQHPEPSNEFGNTNERIR